MFVFYVILAVLLLLWYIQRKRSLSLLQRNGIPGPKPNLIFGNIFEFKSKATAKCFSDWTKTYGPIVGFYVGGVPQVVVSDLELLKLIQMKDWHHFMNKNTVIAGGIHPTRTGQSIFLWKEDQEWKKTRSSLTASFNPSKLKQVIVPNMKPHIDALVKKLGQDCGQEVDIYPMFQEMALSVIVNNAFGLNIEKLLQDPDNPLIRAMRSASDPNLNGVLAVLNILFPEFTFILYPLCVLITTVLEYLDLTPEGVLFHFTENVIRNRKRDKTQRMDLLQLMMDATREQDENVSLEMTIDSKGGPSEKDSQPSTIRSAEHLSDIELVGNSMVLLLAGYETTSSALTFVAHNLVNYPQYQEKMREEIVELLTREQTLDYNTVTGLSVMEAFINETLRMYPPVAPFTTRAPSIDYKYKDITLPKGVGIYTAVCNLHYDPNLWPEPDKFDPQRFLGSDRRKINPIVWQPFGAGPRNCIGMRFAFLEMSLLWLTFCSITSSKFLQTPNWAPSPSTNLGSQQWFL